MTARQITGPLWAAEMADGLGPVLPSGTAPEDSPWQAEFEGGPHSGRTLGCPLAAPPEALFVAGSLDQALDLAAAPVGACYRLGEVTGRRACYRWREVSDERPGTPAPRSVR